MPRGRRGAVQDMADADPQETGAGAGTAGGVHVEAAPLQSGAGALAEASAEAVVVSQCSSSTLQWH